MQAHVEASIPPKEKTILLGSCDCLHWVKQFRTLATSQRDENSLCVSKFESDHLSHAVSLASADARPTRGFNHGGGAPILEGQRELGSVERLDLAFLVNREHEGTLGCNG